MPGFGLSSSPPLTPDTPRNGFGLSSPTSPPSDTPSGLPSFADRSFTPAHDPPVPLPSTTPIAPPPQSVFGSNVPTSNLFSMKPPSTNGTSGKNLFGNLTASSKPLFGATNGTSFGNNMFSKASQDVQAIEQKQSASRLQDSNAAKKGSKPEDSPQSGVVDLISDDDDDNDDGTPEIASPLPAKTKEKAAPSTFSAGGFSRPQGGQTSSIFGMPPPSKPTGPVFANGAFVFGGAKKAAADRPEIYQKPLPGGLPLFATSGNSIFGKPKEPEKPEKPDAITFPRLNPPTNSLFAASTSKASDFSASTFAKSKQTKASFAEPINGLTSGRVNRGFEVPFSDFEPTSSVGPSASFNNSKGEFGHGLGQPSDSPSSGRKRSRDDILQDSWVNSAMKSTSSEKQLNSGILAIAQDFAKKAKPAASVEPGSFVVRTDHQLSTVYGTELSDARASALVLQLSELWLDAVDEELEPPSQTRQRISTGIDSPLAKAQMLASLLLSVHHPPPMKARFDPSKSLNRSTMSGAISHVNRFDGNSPSSVPRACLDWLEQHRDTIKDQFFEVQTCEQNPTAHPQFWETINATLIRGRFEEVIRVLKQADFRYAQSAIEDGAADIGYEGTRLLNVQKSVTAAVRILQDCPALHGDWNMQDQDWQDYRASVKESLDSLARFAEGKIIEPTNFRETFSASHFGMSAMSSGNQSISQAARSAQSLVPWNVYTSLKEMYAILLGSSAEIVANAFDWVEATLFLTIWWDGEDTNVRLDRSVSHKVKRSNRDSHKRNVTKSDGSTASYVSRMTTAFHQISEEDSDEDNFQVDSMNDLELGLAALFEGSNETVIRLLRSWSLTVTGAVVEIGTQARWLRLIKPNRGYGFDDEDLMVLDYNQDQPKAASLTRDSILLEYAEKLFRRGVLAEETTKEGDGKNLGPLEGWEIGLRVLGRVHDQKLVSEKVRGLLASLDVTASRHRANKVIRTCDHFGFEEQARDISLTYATALSERTRKYGEALIYYARAHKRTKVKAVLDLLISFSLVHSTAYPPAQLLDEDLRSLIETPETAIAHLESLDPEAADIVAEYISGYATLRKFYDARDSGLDTNGKKGRTSTEQQREAGKALVSLIASCKQNIAGGLYDRDSGAIISVDGLLALLGEALIFVNQPSSILDLDAIYTILEAVEDLETVSLRVYNLCEELLAACLAPSSDPHDQAAGPSAALKKLSSSLTASSGFSMITGSFVNGGGSGSNGTQENGSSRDGATIGSSGVLVSAAGGGKGDGKAEQQTYRRGWDWRKGFGDRKFNGRDVLRQLRGAIAHDVAKRALRPRRGGAEKGDGDQQTKAMMVRDGEEMKSARGFDRVGSGRGLVPWL